MVKSEYSIGMSGEKEEVCISREQAEMLVRSIPRVQEQHLDSRNQRAAGEYYQKMLSRSSVHAWSKRVLIRA